MDLTFLQKSVETTSQLLVSALNIGICAVVIVGAILFAMNCLHAMINKAIDTWLNYLYRKEENAIRLRNLEFELGGNNNEQKQ